MVSTASLDHVAEDSRCVRGSGGGSGFTGYIRPDGSFNVDLLRGYRGLEVSLDRLGHRMARFEVSFTVVE